MTSTPTAAILIDVISDVVCPWCYIGKKRLEKALAARPDLDATVRWLPYQLDHTIPREGMPRIEYMTRKFGSAERVAAIHERLKEAGREEGIDFAFDKIEVSPNTLDAHRVIRWAAEAGVQNEVKDRLMRGFFLEGANLADQATLARLAGEAGMKSDEVAQWLATDIDREKVTRDVQRAQQMGIQGVPFFIIAGKVGLSGAQPPAVIVQAIDHALKATG